MANKERNKRSARKARAAKRAEAESKAAEAVSEGAEAKSVAKAAAKKPAKSSNGVFALIKNYFGAVRTEMHRVVWPSRSELKDYTIGVIVMLIIFGVCIWAVDNLVVLGLTSFASLRG